MIARRIAAISSLALVMVAILSQALSAQALSNDRPSDPFGDYTIELDKDVPLARTWELLRDKMAIEEGYFHKCLASKACPLVEGLTQRLDMIRQYRGKALLGHLNLSVNLMVTPSPGDWTTPLEALSMRHGDCKAYSIAKYVGAQELGLSADDVRLVIVHDRRRSEDHMVVAVYQEGEWLILDNLTNFLVPDTDKTDYEPLAVLDYQGARRYRSAFWAE